ncbi:MAG: response regulator transcription factor [Archangium sp.]|nr:response regulator transcription factor [Archangium sp.]
MSDRLLRCLVVEDEWPARNYLVELLHASKLAEVVGAVATVEEANEALTSAAMLGVDVAFVDVQLSRNQGNRAGLELARQLSAQAGPTRIVLATAFEEHALEAYQLGVADYLLKPFSEERVVQCLTRLKQRQRAPASGAAKIVARRKRNLVFLSPDEVWAFEAADRLTFVHTRHGKFDIDLSLAAIELAFGAGLERVHRNWLVNVAHVKELERDSAETTLFVGDGVAGEGAGIHVPVSRDRAQEVREALLERATGVRRG